MFYTVNKSELEKYNEKNKGKDCSDNIFVDINLIDSCIQKAELIIKKLQKINLYKDAKDFENLFKSSRRAVVDSEDLTQLIRTIPINFGDKDGYHNLKKDLAGNTGKGETKVTISIMNDQTIYIVLKDLLPRRLNNQKIYENLDYIRCTYIEAFREFFQDKHIIYDERVVILFKHFYTSETGLVDDDNFDYKIITDIIAEYILVDDNPKRCMKVFDYGIAEERHTEITIFPIHEWLKYIEMPFV